MLGTLTLQDVSLAFGGLQVLERVSFQAKPGELLALIGPNGAGKTSVLNCICGIYRPNGGRIERHFVFRPDDHSFDLKFVVEEPGRLGFEREYQLGFNTPLEPTEPDLTDDWTNMQAAAMMAGSRVTLNGERRA
jgi:ABC-type glutathione transport system ATPase component